MRASHVTTILFLLLCKIGMAQTQTYYGTSWHSPPGFWNGYSKLHKLTINNNSCSDQTIGIFLGALNDSINVNALCHCPDNFLYASDVDDSTHLYKINPANAQIVSTITLSDNIGVNNSLVCNAANKIHALKGYVNPRFVEIDPSNGNVTVLGSSNETFSGDMIQHDSVWYSMDYYGIRRIDVGTAPLETELLFTPNNLQGGLSVYPGPCNTFLTMGWSSQTSELYLTNIDTHTSSFLCQTSELFFGLTRVGGDYYDPDPSCPIPIDLDGDDSSGATGSNYNSLQFDCKTNNVKIADNDAFIPSYPIIDTMRVSITGGILDPGKEGLFMGLPPVGIGVSGNTTTTITLTNASGNARVADFLDALKSVQYKDIALSPLGGTRQVTVSFVTRQGFPTDTAICYVNVQQFPQVPVDLGSDVAICQGDFMTLDAGNPGLSYTWIGGQTTQTINAFTSSTYKVTVSDGVRCPGADEVLVKVLPNIPANVLGADTICVGDTLQLNFQWNNPGSFNLNMSNNIGQTAYLQGMTNGSNYLVVPPIAGNTTTSYNLNYYFEQVVLFSSTACLVFDQPAHALRVNASPEGSQNAYICQGDSLNIGGIWRTQSGVYTTQSTLPTGCTLTMHTNLTVTSPGNQTTILQSTTCDPAAAGVFTQNLNTFNGCDSTVVTTIIFNPSDSVFIASQTCDPALAGVFTQNLINQYGCDSVIVSTVSLNPSDTVYLASQTCDPALAGVFTQNLINQYGCDSTIISNVLLNLNDTIFISLNTCDTSEVGVFIQNLTSSTGCDSTVVTTISLAPTNPVGFYHLSGICEGDTAAITFLIPGFDAYDFRMTTSDGTVDTLFGVSSQDVLYVNPTQPTFYYFQPLEKENPQFCLTLNNVLFIQVGQHYFIQNNSLLCEGDSLFVGNAWQQSAGVYVDSLSTVFGCDSIVQTTITVLPTDAVYIAAETCDPTQDGIFTQVLTNQNGCDSIVVTNVALQPNHSTYLLSTTCDPDQAGIFTDSLQNQFGCDSIVVTTYSLLPSDTTIFNSQTCDPVLAGVFTENLINQYGCDSLIITNIALAVSDTFFLASQTCDPALAGIFTENLTNQSGCDSTIVSTISLATSDSTILELLTCDPASAGTSTAILTNQYGCDSVVVQVFTLQLPDTTLLAAFTCEPSEAGVFEEYFTDMQGCDSLVMRVVSLLPADSCVVFEGLKVYITNSFSPNNDGINDVFTLFTNGQAMQVNSLRIFSRWGEKVFELHDFPPNNLAFGWDGSFREKPMDAGLYIYWAEVLGLDGKLEIVKGEVLLVK